MRRDEFPIVDKYAQKQVNDVLDKIRTEIEEERTFQRSMDHYGVAVGLRKSLYIIDKYIAEREDNNDDA